jgi:hypothetical protein
LQPPSVEYRVFDDDLHLPPIRARRRFADKRSKTVIERHEKGCDISHVSSLGF